VFVAGVGSVKLLQTTRGRVILLDAGFTSYYSMVQQELDDELRRSLEPFGFDRSLAERIRPTQIGHRDYNVRHWEASCGGPCSPAKIGLAFTKAAKRRGAVARSSVESWDDGSASGEMVLITVGSRRYATHRITIRTTDHAPGGSPPAQQTPKLALVIDDFGYSRSETVEAFLSMDLPLTIAVIPSLPRTRYTIERARAVGKEPILHLPMEGEGYDSEDQPIVTTMSDDGIRELVDRYLEESSGVLGVNNHQGSIATRDRRVMLHVISVVKNHGLFFLDSLTSNESIAYNTAKSLEVPTAKNDLFLDDDTEDPAVVEDRLLRLLALAKQRGYAIGICHPKPWTYEAIQRNREILDESGVELVFVSELME
jgi:polysaccharide deacetylase 2 family uncharacterized protein YibQ